jgi:hypothetical protein
MPRQKNNRASLLDRGHKSNLDPRMPALAVEIGSALRASH